MTADPIRVLVVDDDFMVAKLHSAWVSRTEGFTVVGVAHTAEQATAAVAELRPDLLLLDVYLPDRSGIELLRELRAQAAELDVLVVTAAREVATLQQALRGGWSTTSSSRPSTRCCTSDCSSTRPGMRPRLLRSPGRPTWTPCGVLPRPLRRPPLPARGDERDRRTGGGQSAWLRG